VLQRPTNTVISTPRGSRMLAFPRGLWPAAQSRCSPFKLVTNPILCSGARPSRRSPSSPSKTRWRSTISTNKSAICCCPRSRPAAHRPNTSPSCSMASSWPSERCAPTISPTTTASAASSSSAGNDSGRSHASSRARAPSHAVIPTRCAGYVAPSGPGSPATTHFPSSTPSSHARANSVDLARILSRSAILASYIREPCASRRRRAPSSRHSGKRPTPRHTALGLTTGG
jgi:hypothetical protein